MIKIDNIAVEGWAAAIRGMRNPYDSWAKSDSHICYGHGRFVDCTTETDKCPRFNDDFTEDVFCIGKNDMSLMQKLVKAGDCHAKFARMIIVTMDVTAPLYWWKQASTYKISTVENSCSTMHSITKKEFVPEDFSYRKEGILQKTMPYVIKELNDLRWEYMNTEAKSTREDIWEAIIQLLPESYNQKRTWQMDYQTLRNIYTWRKDHKLSEWHDFCRMIESLPYAKELITGGAENGNSVMGNDPESHNDMIEHVGYDEAQCGREK